MSRLETYYVEVRERKRGERVLLDSSGGYLLK